MKTKGNNDAVCHAWASQSQESMSNTGGSLYFEDNTIYSYGAHFPIATHVNNDVVLFTIHTYSVTTGAHMSKVRQAITHKTVFYVDHAIPDMTGEYNHAANLKSYGSRFKEILNKASRARSNKSFLLESAINLANEANYYASYFGISWIIETDNIDLDSIKVELDKLKVEAVKKDKVRKKQLLIDNQERIAQWRKGENVHLPYDVGFLLRINNERIETSQGAHIPFEDALKLWPMINRARKNNTTYQPDGYKVGYYNLKSINENGDLKIDCHFIKFEELQIIANQMNLKEY